MQIKYPNVMSFEDRIVICEDCMPDLSGYLKPNWNTQIIPPPPLHRPVQIQIFGYFNYKRCVCLIPFLLYLSYISWMSKPVPKQTISFFSFFGTQADLNQRHMCGWLFISFNNWANLCYNSPVVPYYS